jgi:hypothetical protein
MTREQWIFYAVGAYLLLFMGVTVGIFVWIVKRSAGRAPVAFKLLRGPGETLRRRIAKFDEDFVMRMGGAALIPLGVGLAVFAVLAILRPRITLVVGLGITIMAFAGTLIPALRWALRDLNRYRNDRLGYLGEREVAEHLMPLLARGYQVFHDVPAEGAKTGFNLDHVAVGPSGVALIETKTRRKGRARPGMKDHVVIYDGRQLIWPWGEDRHGLEQAVNEADWLRKFILQRTGIETTVKPILAIPGWWVETKARGDAVVLNAKNVASAVEGNGPRVLSDQQIDLIARQLDERCRDVVD